MENLNQTVPLMTVVSGSIQRGCDCSQHYYTLKNLQPFCLRQVLLFPAVGIVTVGSCILTPKR